MPRESAKFPIGDRLPGTKYVVRKKLGEGGMGFCLEVVKEPGIQAVVKMIHPEFAERPESLRRFFDEVRILAKLRHPNIVQVTDYDQIQGGAPFYAMELLVGKTLRQLIRDSEAVAPTIAYEIMRQMLEGLAHAHAHTPCVVHRDIKPENIFLHAPDVGEPCVKIIDFGVARFDDVKEEGKIIGTPKYMAPEQLSGEGVTPKADLYSAGLVLFEMLAGRGPFEGVGVSERLRMVRQKRPAPSIHDFAAWVPDSIEKVLASALAIDPRDRPEDAFAFQSKLFELQFFGGRHVVNTTAPTLSTMLHSASSQSVESVAASRSTTRGARTERRMETPAIEGATLEEAPKEFFTAPTVGVVGRPRELAAGVVNRANSTESLPVPAPQKTPAPRSGTQIMDLGAHADASAEGIAAIVAPEPAAERVESTSGTARSLRESFPKQRERGLLIRAGLATALVGIAATIATIRFASNRNATVSVAVAFPEISAPSAMEALEAPASSTEVVEPPSASTPDADAPSAPPVVIADNSTPPAASSKPAPLPPAVLPWGRSNLVKTLDDKPGAFGSPGAAPRPKPSAAPRAVKPARKAPFDDGAHLLFEGSL